jgi:hypothetical protein
VQKTHFSYATTGGLSRRRQGEALNFACFVLFKKSAVDISTRSHEGPQYGAFLWSRPTGLASLLGHAGTPPAPAIRIITQIG